MSIFTRARPQCGKVASARQSRENVVACGPEGDNGNTDQSQVGEDIPLARGAEDAAEKQEGADLGAAQGGG